MKTRKQRNKRTQRRRQTVRRGGEHALSKKQYKHLKLTLKRMGPEYHHIFTVWREHNRTAKKPEQLLDDPSDILEYAHYKSSNPEYQDWSVADNQYVRYQEPRYKYWEVERKQKMPTTPATQNAGGSLLETAEIIQHAKRIQTAAHALDEFHEFAIGGSAAVHIFLYELLTTDRAALSPEEAEQAANLLETLAAPNDLDFKYQKQGRIFADAIVHTKPAPVLAPAPVPTPVLSMPSFGGPKGLGLKLGIPSLAPMSLSIATEHTKSNSNSECESYIDLEEFRCCDPPSGSPIFTPRQGVTNATPFEVIEFNPPQEFKNRRIPIVEIANLQMLGIRALTNLYEKYERKRNAPKLSALRWILNFLNSHPELAEKYGA